MDTIAINKGRIVIPAPVRRKLGITEDTRIHIQVDEANQQIILTPITRAYIDRLRGKYKGLGLLETLMEDKQKEREL
jgi:AbrB family looped-hinge helix DNA binding protein